jgi:hypothetical protein
MYKYTSELRADELGIYLPRSEIMFENHTIVIMGSLFYSHCVGDLEAGATTRERTEKRTAMVKAALLLEAAIFEAAR